MPDSRDDAGHKPNDDQNPQDFQVHPPGPTGERFLQRRMGLRDMAYVAGLTSRKLSSENFGRSLLLSVYERWQSLEVGLGRRDRRPKDWDERGENVNLFKSATNSGLIQDVGQARFALSPKGRMTLHQMEEARSEFSKLDSQTIQRAMDSFFEARKNERKERGSRGAGFDFKSYDLSFRQAELVVFLGRGERGRYGRLPGELSNLPSRTYGHATVFTQDSDPPEDYDFLAGGMRRLGICDDVEWVHVNYRNAAELAGELIKVLGRTEPAVVDTVINGVNRENLLKYYCQLVEYANPRRHTIIGQTMPANSSATAMAFYCQAEKYPVNPGTYVGPMRVYPLLGVQKHRAALIFAEQSYERISAYITETECEEYHIVSPMIKKGIEITQLSADNAIAAAQEFSSRNVHVVDQIDCTDPLAVRSLLRRRQGLDDLLCLGSTHLVSAIIDEEAVRRKLIRRPCDVAYARLEYKSKVFSEGCSTVVPFEWEIRRPDGADVNAVEDLWDL